MEDYDRFVQQQLSYLRKSEEEHNKPSPASSSIRFYGQAILPPLLSGDRREEMQRHRDAALKADVHRKLKDDARMAYVQTILHSVQLRKTPTLEELLQESEMNTKSSYSHNTSSESVSQSNYLISIKDSLSLSSPPERKHGVSLPQLTSTTYSAFFTSNVTPLQSYQQECLIDQHYSQQGSQPSSPNGASHQSSGYVTSSNVENATSVSRRIDTETESHGFGSSEGAHNMVGFFLHSTSNTVAKMPDIISHPPIDGEELERSGLESSICNHFLVVEDISCFSLQEDSAICDRLPVEKSEKCHLDSTGGEDNPPVTAVLDPDKDHGLDRIESPVSSSVNGGFSDNSDTETLSAHHCATTELHVQYEAAEPEPEPAHNHTDEEEPSEEPYRLSLQALLKKSQEYRRCQRMLRNQAKNIKIQERAQEQPRARAEEQSLSDKENDEFPYKGAVTAEGKKTKERKSSFISSVETSPNTLRENERTIESEFIGEKANFKSESTHSTGDGNSKEIICIEEEKNIKNSKLNISQEVLTESAQISAFPQQQTLSVQEAFYLTTCPTGAGKYNTIPAPSFCRSPVHCKRKGDIQDGEAVDEAETTKRKVLVNTGSNEEHKVEDVHLGHEKSPTAVPSTVNLMVEGDLTGALTKSSQHIDQLESNLSSLKVLISDLESTLIDSLENQSQQSNTQSGFSFEGNKHSEQHMQLRQSDCERWAEKLRDDGDGTDPGKDQRCGERQRRQSDSSKNMQEDTGPEPSISEADDVPHIVQVTRTEAVDLSELRLVKTLAAERGKEKGTCKEVLPKSHGGCRKQQPPAKHIVSLAQQLRIPDVFRKVPSETTAPRKVSVLSDTSNHPLGRRNEAAVEGPDSTHSASLNQSYDVDAPSDLWLLEGSGSDSGSRGRLDQQKHLTPESGGEGQGGVSKVKRRLLMHVTEETQRRGPDAGGGAGSVVRPNSSTPRAAVLWHEGHGSQKDKEEQLKQAHASQVRALQDEHRRQQEELLQALAVRYRLLQSVSFPCSMSGSRLGDTLTFSTLSQASSPLSEHYRPLLLAATKGFLTRRLLRTERVEQLVRTIRDTLQFLQALQQQSPGGGLFYSRQDLLLQERVSLQLRAARYEVNDIFFSLSAGERMQLISWDRELARERELRRQSGNTEHPRRKSSLSAATQKSLERKRGLMIQKKAAGRHRGAVTRTGPNTGSSSEQPLETKRGQFRANPQRVPKSTYSSRPR
ncbi:uncharacterized protein cp110 [Pempheris klunzingeri]|uniref:uncharacterized protein cp110 n=1 Tax=Pempheris klunzingeri TaxID=3127111 RepID=UPI003980D070